MSGFASLAKDERLRFLWIFLAIFILAAGVRVSLAGRHCLWVDELFSLAIATGHSLEHPAAAAKPELGRASNHNMPCLRTSCAATSNTIIRPQALAACYGLFCFRTQARHFTICVSTGGLVALAQAMWLFVSFQLPVRLPVFRSSLAFPMR